MAVKERKYTVANHLLNIITYLTIFVLQIVFWVNTSVACKNYNSVIKFYMTDVFTWLFSILGTIFLISGISMAITLRKYYVDFYQEFGSLIWVATFCLSIPLYMRGLNLYLYKNSDNYLDYYTDHFAAFNAGYVLFSSILPVVAQMGTLIFGFKH